MRILPSLIGAATAACVLFSSNLPALAQKSGKSGNSSKHSKPSKPAQAKWDPSKVNRNSLGSRAATQALSYRGVPYHFGGQSRNGIDCSALIQTSFKKWGIWLPRTSVEQYRKGIPVPKTKLKPGDLVFFKNTYRRGVSHVGIYLGNNQFVHASSGRGRVTVSSLNEAYYQNHWAGARRVALDKEPSYLAEAGDEAEKSADTLVRSAPAKETPATEASSNVTTASEETTSVEVMVPVMAEGDGMKTGMPETPTPMPR